MLKASLIFGLLCLALTPCLLEAGPLAEEKGNGEVVEWFLRQLKVNRRVRRQSSTPVCMDGAENASRACLPDGVNDAPTSLVNCVSNECVCNECFMMDSETGRCRLCSDYTYSEVLQTCGNDNRQSQLTAFLLSFFLSGTGAANFYIGQMSLGGGQIAILLIIMATSYAMCCLPCCLACCVAKEEVKGSAFFIIFMLLFVLITIGCILAAWAWWIADLVIFATNQRLSGNGCVLMQNL